MATKNCLFLLFFTLCLLSCKEDSMMTSGQRMISELQSVIAEQEAIEVQVRTAGQDGFPGGSSDFSFQNESIRVGDQYYNVNRLISYWVDTYTKEINGREYEVKYLIIVMDLL